MRNQTYKIERLIIVDNCSSDGTIDFLKEWIDIKADFDKDVVYLSENTGGARWLWCRYGLCARFSEFNAIKN